MCRCALLLWYFIMKNSQTILLIVCNQTDIQLTKDTAVPKDVRQGKSWGVQGG